MLKAGGDFVGGGQVIALVAPDGRFGHPGDQQRVLAGRLHHTAPAGVAHQVAHWREGQLDAGRGGFPGGHRGGFLHQAGVEAAAHRQRDRVDGLEAVDDVGHKEHRDMVGLALHVALLHLDDVFGAEGV